ncbi:MAG: RrF2 family transcriptional regulator [Eggerthellaceae bacterium]|jgi:Rrf2 family protein
MLVSTKGRYALRLAIYIASSSPDEPVALKSVAQAEDISIKYSEQLARALVKGNVLKSVRGFGGGYTLARDPRRITAGDILRAVQGEHSVIGCTGLDGECERMHVCSIISFMRGLEAAVIDYVDSVTLYQLVQEQTLAHLSKFFKGDQELHEEVPEAKPQA